MAGTGSGGVIDFMTGKRMDAEQLEEAVEKYGEVSDGISPDFRAMLDTIAPATARLVGTHRGVLAGMADDERDRVVDEYLASVMDGDYDDLDGGFGDDSDIQPALAEAMAEIGERLGIEIDPNASPAEVLALLEEEVGKREGEFSAFKGESGFALNPDDLNPDDLDPDDLDLDDFDPDDFDPDDPDYLGFDPAVPAGYDSLTGAFNPVRLLLERCEPGAVRTKLSQLLVNAPMDWLRDVAGDYGIGDFATTSRKKMAARLATAMAGRADALRGTLGGLPNLVFQGVRRVYEAGGTLTIADDDIDLDAVAGLPIPTPPLLFCFHRDAQDDEPAAFTFVIADELMRAFEGMDWDAAALPIKRRSVLGTYVAASVAMRGIVPQGEFIERYTAEVDDPIAADMVDFELPYALREILEEIHVLLPIDEEDEAYLLAAPIAHEYLDEHPECEPEYPDDRLIDGDLDDTLIELLDAQEEFEPAPVPPELLAAADYYEWIATLPGAQALRAFVDEHIPDGEDDYCFADTLVEDVQILARTGFTSEEYRLFIERMYPVDDADLLVRVWELALDVAAETPRWDLNGWSAAQAAELV